MGLKKSKNITAARKSAQREMSRYIRLLWTKEDGTIDCCTCGATLNPEKDKVDAGHFIGAQIEITRWNEHNVHPQCWKCNHYAQNGMAWAHAEHIRLTHGEDIYQELLTLAKDDITFDTDKERIEWTMAHGRRFKQQYEELLEARNG